MTNEEREQRIQETLDIARGIRQTKGIEYAKDGDINAAFNNNTDIGLDSIHSCAIYLDKQYKAVRHYVKDRQVLSEPIRMRIVDAINYLLIMDSLISVTENTNEKLQKVDEENIG